MKLKYYLKGLGTGILFAAIILSISFAVYDRQNEKKMQDDIIAAALDAGMVWPEETSSNDTTTPAPTESGSETTPEETTPEATTPEETTPEETTPEETTPEATMPEETTPVETTPEATTPEETTTVKEPETTAKKDYEASIIYKDNEKARIQILRGMNSYDVAIILERAGVLKGYTDREAFNDYLVAQGYGGFVMVGVFEIPVGATYDEIINIVCKK